MRPKLVLALLGALAAFFVAFFGATGTAHAAATTSSTSTSLARPGAYGAPLCDDRAASAYAAEPSPQPVDSGTIDAQKQGDPQPSTPSCRSSRASLRIDSGTPVHGDDLQRSQPSARSVALLPSSVSFDAPVAVDDSFDRCAADGARDGHVRIDSPPPRPSPWRR